MLKGQFHNSYHHFSTLAIFTLLFLYLNSPYFLFTYSLLSCKPIQQHLQSTASFILVLGKVNICHPLYLWVDRTLGNICSTFSSSLGSTLLLIENCCDPYTLVRRYCWMKRPRPTLHDRVHETSSTTVLRTQVASGCLFLQL